MTMAEGSCERPRGRQRRCPRRAVIRTLIPVLVAGLVASVAPGAAAQSAGAERRAGPLEEMTLSHLVEEVSLRKL